MGKYIDGEGDGARGVKRKAVVSTATTISSSSASTTSSATGPKASSATQAKSEVPAAVAVGSKAVTSASPAKPAR